MVGYLYLFAAELMKETAGRAPRAVRSSEQYVLDAIRFIQFNYSRDIGIDDIARAVGVSRSHLYRVFMSHVGCSPADYLTKYRIGEACALKVLGALCRRDRCLGRLFRPILFFPCLQKACRRAAQQISRTGFGGIGVHAGAAAVRIENICREEGL